MSNTVGGDLRRINLLASAGYTADQARSMTNGDIARIVSITALGLTQTQAAKLSGNDMRVLRGQRAKDDA